MDANTALKEPRPFRFLYNLVSLIAAGGIYVWLAAKLEHFVPLEDLSMITGYIAFVFIGTTLIIGPLKQ